MGKWLISSLEQKMFMMRQKGLVTPEKARKLSKLTKVMSNESEANRKKLALTKDKEWRGKKSC